jgi:ABC-type Mn2+/Zn2+ transport system ATPase subunit
MAFLRLMNGGFRYPSAEKYVFRHFGLEIKRGEALRVTGRNGSGKSTLLKALAGVLKLSEGELKKQKNACIAYMDQFSGDMLARELTIAEHLKAVSVNLSSEPMSAFREFDLGLQDRLDSFVGHLSGGERQIVALLCTLASGANVLCLDEFTSALDVRSTEIAEQLIAHAHAAADIAILLVSHSGTNVTINRTLDLGDQENPSKGDSMNDL